MKKFLKILSCVLAGAMAFALVSCGNRDEWDGEKVMDNSLAETMRVNSGIINPPTVVSELTSKTEYESLTGNALKPASVILRLNEKFNVVDGQGKRLCSFSELYESTLKGKIIPVIRISDESEAERAVTLFTERYDLLDASVISENPDLVKSVRKECPKIGGIVEFNAVDDLFDVVRITNANGGAVAVLPQSLATAENVYFLQARFKTVWVRPENSQKFNLHGAIVSGAYGIVTNDYLSALDALADYGEGSVTRAPFVVAHRGLPNTHNENSVSGVRASISAGATHLELDGYLTRDNRIAMMHDHTLDRTSDGKGVIEDYKLEELQNFKLDLHAPNEPIPSIDDIFEEMKGTDVVLLFEIKSQKTAIVTALKEALEKHGMARQVVVISFHTRILEAMSKLLPEVPTASLNDIDGECMEDAILSLRMLNTGTSTHFPAVTPEMNAVLRDRGVVGWFWTYETAEEMTEAVLNGFTGLTTNCADEFVESYRYARIKRGANVSATPVAGAEIPLIGVTYKNTEEAITGKVFYTEDLGDRYAVIASYPIADGRASVYTPIFYVSK